MLAALDAQALDRLLAGTVGLWWLTATQGRAPPDPGHPCRSGSAVGSLDAWQSAATSRWVPGQLGIDGARLDRPRPDDGGADRSNPPPARQDTTVSRRDTAARWSCPDAPGGSMDRIDHRARGVVLHHPPLCLPTTAGPREYRGKSACRVDVSPRKHCGVHPDGPLPHRPDEIGRETAFSPDDGLRPRCDLCILAREHNRPAPLDGCVQSWRWESPRPASQGPFTRSRRAHAHCIGARLAGSSP